MVARVSQQVPPAAQKSPDAETREKGLRALRLELEAQDNQSLKALLWHSVAQLHEQRDDLAAAARDELAATKCAAGFVEPLEALVGIATRSRSKANLQKLLQRLKKLAQSDDEKQRALLGLAMVQSASDDFTAARETLEDGLDQLPQSLPLWLALEGIAAKLGDSQLQLKASLGRAAHAHNPELRCLLLERVSRLQLEAGDSEAAFDSLRQSIDEVPTFRALRSLELAAFQVDDFVQASEAARQIATLIRGAIEEEEEAELYQVPQIEKSEARAIAAQFRGVLYSLKGGNDEEALAQAQSLVDTSPHSAFSQLLAVALLRKSGDFRQAALGVLAALKNENWSTDDRAFLASLGFLSLREEGLDDSSPDEESAAAKESLFSELELHSPSALLTRVIQWERAETTGDLKSLLNLFQHWSKEEEPGETQEQSRLAQAMVLLLAGDHERASASIESLVPQSASHKGREALDVGSASSADSPVGQTAGDEENGNVTRHSAAESPAAAKTHSAQKTHSALLSSILRFLSLQQEDAREEKRVSRSLYESLQTDEGRLSTAWARLRRHLLTLGQDTETAPFPDCELPEGMDSWGELCLALIEPRHIGAEFTSPDAESGRNEELAANEERLSVPRVRSLRNQKLINQVLEEDEPGEELRTALHAFSLASHPEQIKLEKVWKGDTGNLFLSGALLDATERLDGDTVHGAKLPETLLDCAQESAEPEFAVAWVLKSLFASLTNGDIDAAAKALSFLPEQQQGELQALAPWLLARRHQGAPRETLKALTELKNDSLEGELPEERELDYLALLHSFSREELDTNWSSEPSPPEQLLRVLGSAPHSREELEYALDVSPLFPERLASALALAPKFAESDSEELLGAAISWKRASSTVPALLTTWVAARRCEDGQREAQTLLELGDKLKNQALISHADSFELEGEQSGNRAKLLQFPLSEQPAATAEAQSNQDSESSEYTEASLRQAVAWGQAEESDAGITDEAAQVHLRLSETLDHSLEDPDSQLAMLLAGFQYLLGESWQEALSCFEALHAVIPTDLTLCQGLRTAAAQVGRADLEAEATAELARHAADNLTSAALWERAGLLYQDQLNQTAEAEDCFNAAMTRSPGSPLAFERVYRFARARKDRARQVELIDARLDSARSETLRIELFWEKARFCRMLGRRTVAQRSLEELLNLAPDHLPSLALSAELHLVDNRMDAAADALRRVALHPDTPNTERRHAGLFASDLYEQLHRPRDAVELLQDLENFGVRTIQATERRARSSARSGDWGAAYEAFVELNDEQDTIEARLESAKMMLAIQRDHLKQPDELKDAARRVLRDSPEDADAVSIVLELNFTSDERRRLLAIPRTSTRKLLYQAPLNPPEISRFSGLCQDCGDETLERISLGVLGLTGRLSERNTQRLAELQDACPRLPNQAWSPSDLESMSAPGQLGALTHLLTLLSPYIAKQVEPSLETLGISPLMRIDEFSDDSLRSEVGTWMTSVGSPDFELYVGGTDPLAVRAIAGDLPTIIIGKAITSPLTQLSQARLLSQIMALLQHTEVYLNHPVDLMKSWLEAAVLFVRSTATPGAQGAVDEMARTLANAIPRDTREEISEVVDELARGHVDPTLLPSLAAHSAARAAIVAFGDPSVLRRMPELLPDDDELRNHFMTDVLRFSLSEDFEGLRKRAGLESA